MQGGGNMGKALKTGLCLFVLALIFVGCPDLNSGLPPPPPEGVKSGQELQAALTDPAVTEIKIAASFVSNVSAIVTSSKTITIPVGYRVVIDALQVEADVVLTNGGSPSDDPGDLTKAGVLVIISKFLVRENVSFSVQGAAELAFMPAVVSENAWINGTLSSQAANSVYQAQQGDITTTLTFSGAGTIKLDAEEEEESAENVTVESVLIAGAPKNDKEESNADSVPALMVPPGAPGLAGDDNVTGKISVSWEAVSGAEAYEVWYDTDNDPEDAVNLDVAGISGTGALITGLEPGEYYVWIKTKIGGWTSGFSETAVLDLPEYSIALYNGEQALGPAGAVVYIDSRISNYTPAPSKTITIRNTGTGATGPLTIALSGEQKDSFRIDGNQDVTSVEDIAAGEDGNFIVAPVTGLEEAGYTAAVSVTGGHGFNKTFTVSFVVNNDLITGSINIAYEDTFGGDPDVSYNEFTPNDDGEIPINWTESIIIQTVTGWFKTIYIDGNLAGEPAAVLTDEETAYMFSPGVLRLEPGPHTVTVFFRESGDGPFAASAVLKFRISK
jgi:hypothetical protein